MLFILLALKKKRVRVGGGSSRGEPGERVSSTGFTQSYPQNLSSYPQVIHRLSTGCYPVVK